MEKFKRLKLCIMATLAAVCVACCLAFVGCFGGSNSESGNGENGGTTVVLPSGYTNVTYYYYDGTGEEKSETLEVLTGEIGEDVDVPPARAGYIFKGYYDKGGIWFYDENGKQLESFGGSSAALYAQYGYEVHEIEMSVTNGVLAEDEATTITVSPDPAQTDLSYIARLPEVIPDDGWYFKGWKFKDTLISDGYFVNTEYCSVEENSSFWFSMTTLTAEMEKIEYTLSLENGDGDKVYSTAIYYYGDTISGLEALPDNAEELTDFKGWSVDKYEFKDYATASECLSVTDNVTLYACWHTYKIVTFELKVNGEEGGAPETKETRTEKIYDDDGSVPMPEYELTGYALSYWCSNQYLSGKQVTEYSYYSPYDTYYGLYDFKEYTITYTGTKDATNNNPVTYTMKSDKITLSGITAVGYTFKGWYNGGKKVTEIATGTTGDLTLTAEWTPIAYAITYNQTRNAANSNPLTYTIESEIILSDITAPGYDFKGWYNGEKKVTQIAAGSMGRLTLTAKWTPSTYEITLSANTSTAETDVTISASKARIVYGENQLVTSGSTFKVSGGDKYYTLAGWCVSGGKKNSRH